MLGEVYDTLFRSNPAQPTSVICWMCDNYEQSVDTNGNTHLLVQLRQNLRWHDRTTIDSKDVKFSLLSLIDLSYQFSSPLVQDVNIVTGTTFDIVMQGQSISNLVILASTPIIPRHIWEKPGDAAYDDVGTVDPAKLDLNYDPITAGTFIGSGQFVCTSLFQIDLGRVGTGCSVDRDGNRAGQIQFDGTITLQRYDMTSQAGTGDPFLQYIAQLQSRMVHINGYSCFLGTTPRVLMGRQI